jgi:hypothetical protein
LQLARLALIVGVPSRCVGPRARLERRRRRGPEGLRAASGALARDLPRPGPPVTGRSCAASGSASSSRGAYPGAVANRARRAPRALEAVLRFLTAMDMEMDMEMCPVPGDA